MTPLTWHDIYLITQVASREEIACQSTQSSADDISDGKQVSPARGRRLDQHHQKRRQQRSRPQIVHHLQLFVIYNFSYHLPKAGGRSICRRWRHFGFSFEDDPFSVFSVSAAWKRRGQPTRYLHICASVHVTLKGGIPGILQTRRVLKNTITCMILRISRR